MRRDNRWTGGPVHLVFPPLRPQEVGRCGAGFAWLDFKVGHGEEMFLEIFEEPEWAARYGALGELTVEVTPMALHTEAGPVGLLIWHLLHQGSSLVNYEHFVEPTGADIRQRITAMDDQTRFKVIVRDNQSGEVTGFWELDNTFSSALRKFVEGCAEAFEGSERGPLGDRIDWVLKHYTSNDLLNLIAQG